MPIYAYRCESCGFGKDVLQKMSDAPLSTCPECGKDTFRKQVTAAGFQLKGSGWYVTDFRGGNSASGAAAPSSNSEAGQAKSESAGSTAAASDGASGGSGSTGGSSASGGAAASPAPAAAPAAASAGNGSSGNA